MKLLLLGLLAFSLLLAGCVEQGGTPQATSTAGPNNYGSGEGRVVFGMTDAAADMQSVSSVKVTVDGVRVHSASEGWVTASSGGAKTYDLLKMKAEGTTELLADAKLKAGAYDQMRLDVSKVVVTDTSGEHEAKLPSNELKIAGELVVKAESTSTATFDFIADESLHATGKGEYVLAPVVQLETRTDANVQVQGGNKLAISGGSVRTNVKLGMDVSGNMGVGVKIPADAVLDLSSSGAISVVGGASGRGSGRAVLGITDAAANMQSVSSVNVTVDKVYVHSEAKGWVEASATQRTYDLLELDVQGRTAVLADLQLQEGTYKQIRLDVSKIVVTDANGSHDAKIPSGEIKLVGDLVVKANSTSTATMDFLANESLHTTGKGQYIFAPVVRLETRADAAAEVASANDVKITGGTVVSNARLGMDVDGIVGAGVKIPADSELEIDQAGKVKVKVKVGVNVGVS